MATVAVDCDGVLYEWSKTARYMLRAYKGYSADGPMGTESTSWDYIRDHVEPEDWAWLWREGVELGLFRYGHVVQGAVIGLRALQRSHKLVLVTHRPASAVNDTLDFISYISNSKQDPIRWSGIHVLTNEEPKSEVGADILIDDKPDNVGEWWITGRHAVLFGRPWNDHYLTCAECPCPLERPHIYRSEGWLDTIVKVQMLSAVR